MSTTEAHARLIKAIIKRGAYSPQNLSLRGGDPGNRAIIALRYNGGIVIPAFQFGPDGQVLNIVRQVNGLLESSEDPYAALAWWLKAQEFPEGESRAPVDFIGVDNPLLFDLAKEAGTTSSN